MKRDLSTATHVFRQVLIGSCWSLEKSLQPLTLLQSWDIVYDLFYIYCSTLHVILRYYNYLSEIMGSRYLSCNKLMRAQPEPSATQKLNRERKI